MATAPPSLEDIIASVPECAVDDAIEWLRRHADDLVRERGPGRWLASEGVLLSQEDVIRRYRLKRATFNRTIMQGVG